jgi:hypothetical protein
MVLPPEVEMPDPLLLVIEIKEEKEKKKGKFQKLYSKKCTVCDGEVEVYQYDEDIDGVIYDRHYLECIDCGCKIELKKDHHKRNDNTKYDW